MFGLLLGTLSKFQAESKVKKEKVRARMRRVSSGAAFRGSLTSGRVAFHSTF